MSAEIGLIVALGFPVSCAALLWAGRWRALGLHCAPWAAAPAFLIAVAGSAGEVAWQHVLFGVQLGVDPVDRGFLLLTSAVWLAAGLFARPYMAADPRRVRFWTFFLVTQFANLGVVLAMDVATFYCFYAAMTFATFGLVVHDQTPSARRAARIYLVLALIGEIAVLAAMFLIVGTLIDMPLSDVPAAIAGSASRDLIVVLVLLGFGVKSGVLGLHVWLPLAHPAAPTPASAVLSGALIKAGLLGWLRFLPFGVVALPGPGLVCVLVGLTSAFYAVAVGLSQRDAKTVLAYSSISQMGFVTTTAGVALAVPQAASVAIVALMFYAVHHAITKAALFLGHGLASRTAGRWSRRFVIAGLGLAALHLAGAPLSSGAMAKLTIKDVVGAGPWEWPSLSALLSIAAVGSTLLMAHFLAVTTKHPPTHAEPPSLGMWLPWCALLVASVALIVASPLDNVTRPAIVAPQYIWTGIWPIAIGLTLFMLFRRLRSGSDVGVTVPPGDLVVFYERAARSLSRAAGAGATRGAQMLHGAAKARTAWIGSVRRAARRVLELERGLDRFAVIGLLFTALLSVGLVLASC